MIIDILRKKWWKQRLGTQYSFLCWKLSVKVFVSGNGSVYYGRQGLVACVGRYQCMCMGEGM